MSERSFVAVGANLGEREAALARALAALRASAGLRVTALSRVFESDAVGGPRGQGAYLNAVIELASELAPRALLERLLAIECALGRVRSGARDEPRVLDLDLLLHGETRVAEPELTLPHPRLAERPFVLVPLAELAPALVPPGLEAPVSELAARCGREGLREHVPGPALAAAWRAPHAIVAVSLSPGGVGVGVGDFVAEALALAGDQDAVRVEPGAMFTTLEGEREAVLALVARMQEALFAKGALRVGTVLKIDERRDRPASAGEKLARVSRHDG